MQHPNRRLARGFPRFVQFHSIVLSGLTYTPNNCCYDLT